MSGPGEHHGEHHGEDHAGHHAGHQDRPLRVLLTFRRPRPTTNPYLTQLLDRLEQTPEVDPVVFTWRAALLGRYDVLHVHWPETLCAGRTRWRRRANQLRYLALLLRARATRTALVRTAHNVSPHEEQGWSGALLERLTWRWTSLVIRLNDHTELPVEVPAVTIPIGHYREWYAAHPPARERHPHRVVHVGLLRAYKGIDTLLDAVAALPEEELELRLVGAPHDPVLAERVRAVAAADRRVHCRLEHVDDADLVAELTGAALAVLPYPRLHNSAALVTALSLDTPVLAPRNRVTEELAAEVGPGWVHLYDGPLTPAALRTALAAAAHRPARPPDLSGRDWADLGARHVEAYLRASRRRSGHAHRLPVASAPPPAPAAGARRCP